MEQLVAGVLNVLDDLPVLWLCTSSPPQCCEELEFPQPPTLHLFIYLAYILSPQPMLQNKLPNKMTGQKHAEFCRLKKTESLPPCLVCFS